MKLSIRKKLIFPLLLLMIMPILILGIFTYWNHNRIILNYEIVHINNELNDLFLLLDKIDKRSLTKEFVLDYIQSLKKENMFIIEENEFLYHTLSDKNIDARKILKAIQYDQDISNQYLLQYGVYHQWNWKIGFLIDKKALSSQNHKTHRAILLLIPLFIFFSLEAIIFITDNISKPIGILLDAYKDMIAGNFKKKIHIERKDELGLLGHAFNDMRNEIRNKTNKFIEMKNFNEDILRSISTGIITTNIHGKVIKYNQAAVEIIEKTTQDNPIIIKVLLKQILHTLKTQKTINQVESFQGKEEGRNIYLDITTSLIKNVHKENIGVICSFNDISTRKRIEEKIDQINRLTSLGQLTAALAHEIRNPLSGMKMSCQVLKNRFSNHLDLSDQKLFDATIHEIDRLDELITDLLNFAKPNLPKFQVVQVYEVLENALQFSSKIISQKNIQVFKELKEGSLLAYFDKNQLSQIFLNIIANAVWAMDHEGTLKIKAKKIVEEEKRYILMIFEDNGCGIAKEDIHKIFDPFYTTNKEGTGLGLSVVHRLLTANHGEIEVESQINLGTKIKLYIPLYRGDSNEK